MGHHSTVATRRRKAPLGVGAPRQIRTGAAGQPTLLVNYTSTYDWIWNDDESGADADVAIWRPNPSDDTYCIVGDYAQGDYGSPIGSSLIVKAVNDDPSNPLLTKPKKFVKVWKDKDSGGKYDGSIWAPVPEDGYLVLGFVGQLGYDEPSISNFVCVRRDLCEAADVGAQIWNDSGSDAKDDVSLYAVLGVSGAFVGQANFDPYSGTAYKLKNAQ